MQDLPGAFQKLLARPGTFRIISQAVNLPTDAEIAAEKLTRYLLVKRPVGDKSEFLKQAGYTLDNWRKLEQDIRRQILSKEAVPTEQTPYSQDTSGKRRLTLPCPTSWLRSRKFFLSCLIRPATMAGWIPNLSAKR